ncbi:MAG: T9SS type A sorting domain-containing protein [Flavobacteriales bacterium]|jgi:hypothetical protein|nr:T9SS type A sorting domain-containing protein [Flavobacteriales bacterium]
MKNYILLLILNIFLSITSIFTQQVTIDSCDFEQPCSVIEIDTSSSNIWELGKPSKVLFDSAYSFNRVLITDSISNYPINNHSSFILIPTDNYGGTVPSPAGWADNMLVEFMYKIDSDSLLDGGYIEVSYDYGQSWDNIINDLNVFIDYLPYDDTLYNGEYGVSGTVTEWQYASINWIWSMPIKAFTIDTLMIRFNFISDAIETNKEGWMIDNLRVSYQNYFGNVGSNNFNQIKAYPNPAHESFTIKIKDIDSYNSLLAHLIDNSGRIVLTYPIQYINSQISLKNVPKGLYHLIVKENGNVIGKSKIIKE